MTVASRESHICKKCFLLMLVLLFCFEASIPCKAAHALAPRSRVKESARILNTVASGGAYAGKAPAKPFGENAIKISDKGVRRLLEAMRHVDEIYGKGAVLLYGGAVRDLLRGVTALRGDYDVLIRSDLADNPAVFQLLEQELNLPQGSIERHEARLEGLALDAVGMFNPRTGKATNFPGWEKFLGRIQISINTLGLQADGQLVDTYGGWSDLKNRIVRFVGHAPQKIKEYATMETVLMAMRWKYQPGFRYEEDTRYIVENLLDYRIAEPQFLEYRRGIRDWILKARWTRKYQAARRQNDWGKAAALAMEFLRDLNKRMGALDEELGRLLPVVQAKIDAKAPKHALALFKKFMDKNDLWMERNALDVFVPFSKKKLGWMEGDVHALGKRLGELLQHTPLYRNAAGELARMRWTGVLKECGIDLDEVLKRRRLLNKVLAGKQSIGLWYLDPDVKRYIAGIVLAQEGKEEEFMAVLKNRESAPRLSPETMGKYLALKSQPDTFYAIAGLLGANTMAEGLDDIYDKTYRRLVSDPLLTEALETALRGAWPDNPALQALQSAA